MKESSSKDPHSMQIHGRPLYVLHGRSQVRVLLDEVAGRLERGWCSELQSFRRSLGFFPFNPLGMEQYIWAWNSDDAKTLNLKLQLTLQFAHQARIVDTLTDPTAMPLRSAQCAHSGGAVYPENHIPKLHAGSFVCKQFGETCVCVDIYIYIYIYIYMRRGCRKS